jgi:GT2 family glycosyltransferase
MYVEDLDLCWRLHLGGWRTRLEADVVVPHVGNAAGAKAWGTARMRRWVDATYDWYGQVHGRGGVRFWALTNTLGAGFHAAARSVRSFTGPRRAESRIVARELWSVVPAHAAVVRSGPPPPDRGAPGLSTVAG